MSRVIKAAVNILHKNTYFGQNLALRRCTTGSGAASNCPPDKGDVPGLSKKTVDVPECGVGFPSASKEGVYKNPEYFCFHIASYYEAEVEMNKYRLPQPSNNSNKK